MWCAYAFALFDLISLPAAIRGGASAIVSWVAQTFRQQHQLRRSEGARSPVSHRTTIRGAARSSQPTVPSACRLGGTARVVFDLRSY